MTMEIMIRRNSDCKFLDCNMVLSENMDNLADRAVENGLFIAFYCIFRYASNLFDETNRSVGSSVAAVDNDICQNICDSRMAKESDFRLNLFMNNVEGNVVAENIVSVDSTPLKQIFTTTV